jgi:arylsulfatase A-like enzyme
MHFRTHVRAEHRDKPGLTARTEYNDGMIEHDATSARFSRRSTISGIADDTIVIYTTDNGRTKTVARRRHLAVPQREEPPTGKAPSACRA